MLENVTSSSKGFLHFCVLNRWRAVCSSIQVNAARVVCSQLSGYYNNNGIQFITIKPGCSNHTVHVAVTVQTVPVSQQSPGITWFSCISSAASLSNCSFTFGDCQQPFVRARVDCNDPSASNRPPRPTPSATTRHLTMSGVLVHNLLIV